MNATSIKSPHRLLANLAGLLPSLETAYKDIHAHPELSMRSTAVVLRWVTLGVLQAGSKANGIPDEDVIKLNVRTFDKGVHRYPLNVNDKQSSDPDVHAKAQAEGRINDLPVNHSFFFAPVIHPTLEAGVEAMVVGALAWLAK